MLHPFTMQTIHSLTQFKPSVASCINVRLSSQSKQEMSEYKVLK